MRCFYLTFLFTFLGFIHADVDLSGNANAISAITALYHSTNGPGWGLNTGWMNMSLLSTCEWEGIQCDFDDIIGFQQMDDNSLSGSLPSEFGLLSHLTQLDFSKNSLTGPLPSQLGGLTSLTSNLKFFKNSFAGSIPSELFLLTNMISYFRFDDNLFTGSMPSEIGQLLSMTTGMNFETNLLEGKLPSQLGLLAAFTKSVVFTNNKLSGRIPSQLGQLTLMKASLELDTNSFTGSIPSELGRLTGITNLLDLDTNSLCGRISNLVQNVSGFSANDNPLLGNDCSSPTLVPTAFSKTPTLFPTWQPTISCDAGTYGADCIACPLGQFSSTTSPPWPANCTECPTGTIANTLKSTSCSACASGKFANDEKTECVSCDPGQYAVNSSKCFDCQSGYYAPLPQTDSCFACAAGSHTDNKTKATTCTPCDSGAFSEGLAVSCTLCPTGQYSPSGQSACTDCEAGKVSNFTGSSSCGACGSGTYTSQTGSVSCDECAPGKFVGTTGASDCSNCSVGFVNPGPGSSSCAACSAGKYGPLEAMTRCIDCPSGTSQGGTGQSACSNCIAGTYAQANGSSSCDACLAGYSSSAKASSCDLADLDFFVDPVSGLSKVCPSHCVCDGGVLLPIPKAGYYIQRYSLDYAGVSYRCIHKTCEPKESTEDCWSVNYFNDSWLLKNGLTKTCNSDKLQCTKGSHGPLCGACKVGYIFSSTEQRCILCSSSWANVVPMIVLLLIVSVFLYLLKHDMLACGQDDNKWMKVLRRADSGLMRVLWSNYQIVHSVTWSLDVVFPPPFKNLLQLLSFFSFDFISLDCILGNSDYYATVYIWSLIPFMVAFVIVIVYYGNIAWLLYQDEEYQQSSEKLRVQFSYYLLLLTYIVLPTVSLKQFQGLDCFELAGTHYLRTDTSIDCESDGFLAFRVFDVLLILLYMSTPVVWFCLLYSVEHRLNPKTKDRRLARFLRSEDKGLYAMNFLFEPYRPHYYYFEVLEIYRRVVFIGVLPLVSARSDRRAAIGVFLAILSMALYRETQPFIRQSTNLVVYIAQYAILTTFGAALVIDVNLDSGLNSFAFGTVLCVANLIVLGMAIYLSGSRYLKDITEYRLARDRTANGKIEWAVGFSDEKFGTTFAALADNYLSPSQCIVFYYCSYVEATQALRQGIHAKARTSGEDSGVLFTMHQKSQLDNVDKLVFPNLEVVLVCSLPMVLLSTLSESKYLRMLKGSALTALRGDYFGDIADPKPWFNRGVLLPPKQIVRAFQLFEPSGAPADMNQKDYLVDTINETLVPRVIPTLSTSVSSKRPGRFTLKKSSKSSANMTSFSSARSTSSDSMGSSIHEGSAHGLGGSLHGRSSHGVSIDNGSERGGATSKRGTIGLNHSLTWESFLRKPTSCLDYCGDLTTIRLACQEKGWYPVFHYTTPSLGKSIYKTGFRMSTQGQGDGGVYFSTLSPATYDLGTMEYESNIIIDCFGESRLDEYLLKNKLDLVFVYGIEPDILSQAPGGRDNCKMVTKAIFDALALPHSDGNYFLRPDRIMAAFLIDPLDPPLLTNVAMEPLEREKEQDVLSRQALTAAHYNMDLCANETRQLFKLRTKQSHLLGSKQNDLVKKHSGGGWTGRRKSGSKPTVKSHLEDDSNLGVELSTQQGFTSSTYESVSAFHNNNNPSNIAGAADITLEHDDDDDDALTYTTSDLENARLSGVSNLRNSHEKRKSEHLIRNAAAFKNRSSLRKLSNAPTSTVTQIDTEDNSIDEASYL